MVQVFSVADMESARRARSKVSSPSLSGCTKEANTVPSRLYMPNVKENISKNKPPVNQPQQSLEKNRSTKTVELLEATHESMSTKEPLSQESAPLVEEEVQHKFHVVEPSSYYLACLLGWFFWIYGFVDFVSIISRYIYVAVFLMHFKLCSFSARKKKNKRA